jgi:hypothetical protein
MAIIVKEGDHLKLTCASTGNPKPQISWNLKNGHAIPDGAWKSILIYKSLHTHPLRARALRVRGLCRNYHVRNKFAHAGMPYLCRAKTK